MTFYAVEDGEVLEFYCRGERDRYLRLTAGAELAKWRGQNSEILKQHVKERDEGKRENNDS